MFTRFTLRLAGSPCSGWPIDNKNNIPFTDGGGKLLLTQVVSPRYSIQDGVLFFLFELCECLRIVVSDY